MLGYLMPVIGCAALLCATPSFAQTKAPEAPASVMHWYTSSGERAALKVYVDRFEQEGGKWVDEAIAGSAKARAAAVMRITGGNPPTAMSYWTKNQFLELLDANLLNDIDATATAEKWKDHLTPALIEVLTNKGKFIAAPLELFSTNWLWYNMDLLDKAGAAPPKNWDDLFVTLDKLKAAGILPLAFSEQPVNHIRQTVFNAILAGKGGADLYNAVYVNHDAAALASSKFRDVVEIFRRLKDYTDGGTSSRQWNDASNMVITGRAGVQLMGEWAKGEFASAGKVAGKDYGCEVLGGVPVMNANVMIFGKTSDAGQVAAQRHLASVLMNPELQVEFALKKGTVPLRIDAEIAKMDPCGRYSAELVKSAQAIVWDDNAYTNPQAQGAIHDALVSFWNSKNQSVDDFIKRFGVALNKTN